ncbi:uncharacterized protein KY384_000995 [Bacidia gigantensis]|uniref:uncharacterized protein n=1 Tax=Bacidia gigantensis TaxID=2732470 RepID=UPI001D051C4D|nr:uncharacterized protein KY384_000995 [Bacidia gigantensis]KAG8534151.1 hypothetical protein KY384_000995 [Bacidia gigantensis]
MTVSRPTKIIVGNIGDPTTTGLTKKTNVDLTQKIAMQDLLRHADPTLLLRYKDQDSGELKIKGASTQQIMMITEETALARPEETLDAHIGTVIVRVIGHQATTAGKEVAAEADMLAVAVAVATAGIENDLLITEDLRAGRFPSLELSTAFVERNFPAIYIKANDPSSRNDEPTKVRLAYSRERSDKGEKEMDAGEWACRTCGFHNFSGRTKCRSCGQSPFDPSMYASILARNPYVNSGDSDVAPDGSPSQFLIIRGLEASVTEDLLAKGVSKLYKPTSAHSVPTSSAKKDHSKVLSTTGDSNLGAKEDTLRRVLLIRDRRTNESWRYGFAEFATIEDAQAALIRYSSFNRFTISSKPVTADYIHAGVFVPDLNATEATSRFTFSPTGNSATRFRYWDEQVYVSELVVSTTSAVDKTSGSRVRSVQDESSATMGSSKGGKDAENRAKRRKFDTKDSTKQKAAGSSQLQFWSDRHAELHGSKQPSAGRQDSNALDLSMSQVDSSSGTLPANSFLDPRTHVCFLCWERPRNEKNYREHPMTEKHQKNLMDKALVQKAEVLQARSPKTSYIDIARKFCYLCHTHYPSEVRVVQHELLQDSHQENLKDETTIERAKKEMSKPKCIDWDRLLCLLCLEQYYDELSLIGHEIADAKHQEMLKREGCVELAKANLANPNSFADRQRQVCYLCLQKFENVACLSLHEVMSENHKAKSKDLEACAKAKAQVAKQSYADAIGKYCYLCKRDFETEPELIRHEIMDADHNQSLLNAGIVKIAKAKLKDNGIPIKKIIKAVPDAEYRDRAKERRQAFGKTKKISFTPKKVDREPEEDRDEGKAPGSKGASLLNKMGWKAGEGLGAQGTGMTVPIETNLYAAGVGLGAEGGNVGGATEEAERNTKSDYRAFLERTKDKAKERYEKMA